MPVYSSAHLPGIGGSSQTSATDIHCEEVPRREPAGDGAFWWVLLKRTDIATSQVRKAVARAANIAEDLVSCAGSRDRRGTCQQWFSVPVSSIDTPGVLKNIGYQGKIRTLRVIAHPKTVETVGVDLLRWRVRLKKVGGGAAYQKAKPILDHLRRYGCPNFVPRDLFGRNGEWARFGRLLARGERLPSRARDAQPGRCLWAFQHWAFNRWLARRIEDGLLADVVVGDRIRGASGQEEIVVDVERARKRVESWEASVLGPLFGADMSPVADVAAEREQALCEEVDLHPAGAARLRGGRRLMRYQPGHASVEIHGDDLVLQAELPCDAQIHVLLDEIFKPDQNDDLGDDDEADNAT
jgi:tRNA pseudouridine13 synthase